MASYFTVPPIFKDFVMDAALEKADQVIKERGIDIDDFMESVGHFPYNEFKINKVKIIIKEKENDN